jgi:phage-related tail protein
LDRSLLDVIFTEGVIDPGGSALLESDRAAGANDTVDVAAGAAIKATLAKQTQGYALGTNFAPGGLALVGERGPELVNLPRGSQVHPNHKMHNMAGGGGRLTASVMGADLQLVLDRSSRREGRYR